MASAEFGSDGNYTRHLDELQLPLAINESDGVVTSSGVLPASDSNNIASLEVVAQAVSDYQDASEHAFIMLLQDRFGKMS